MPSQARVSVSEAAGQQTQARPRPRQADWSDRLAASPRQLRQAGQLRSLFGERATAANQPVVQGMFKSPAGKWIKTETDAIELADEFIEKHEGCTDETIGKRQREAFQQALSDLATDEEDLGKLSPDYLQDLLDRGPVKEEFGIRQDGRRLHTSVTTEPNFPPRRSKTFGRLQELSEKKKKKPTKKRKRENDSDQEDSDLPSEEEAQGDFSYRDLRGILDKAKVSEMPAKKVEAATRQAVRDFEERSLSFSDEFSVDVQLVVQHILQYHRFNSSMLTGRKRKNMNRETPKQKQARLKREVENESRQHEFEKSGRLLKIDSLNNFKLTLPPDPTENNQVDFAFSALQDVNRPLPNSTLEGAAYKAVYLCVKKVLHQSWRIARKKKPKSKGEDLDKQQRLHFNRVLVDLLPSFDKSTVGKKKDEGVNYVRNTLGFSKFNAKEDLSEEDSSSSDEDEGLGSDQERSIFDVKRTVEENEPKIKTWTATVGTFSKLALQKQLIDQATLPSKDVPRAISKHAHRRRKINRHVRRVSETHQKNFRLVNSELGYLKRKRELLEKKIKSGTGVRRKRAQTLLERLNGFYRRTSVEGISKLSQGSRQWKRKQAAFEHLGLKALESYLNKDGDK